MDDSPFHLRVPGLQLGSQRSPKTKDMNVVYVVLETPMTIILFHFICQREKHQSYLIPKAYLPDLYRLPIWLKSSNQIMPDSETGHMGLLVHQSMHAICIGYVTYCILGTNSANDHLQLGVIWLRNCIVAPSFY